MSVGATLITLTILVCTFTFPYALKFINSEGWIWWVWSQVFWSIFCNVKDWTLTCFTLNIPSPHWSSLVFHLSLSSKTRGSSSCEEPSPLTGSKTCTLEHPDKWMLKKNKAVNTFWDILRRTALLPGVNFGLHFRQAALYSDVNHGTVKGKSKGIAFFHMLRILSKYNSTSKHVHHQDSSHGECSRQMLGMKLCDGPIISFIDTISHCDPTKVMTSEFYLCTQTHWLWKQRAV